MAGLEALVLFGRHQDRTNTHHGLLLVNNDDTVAPATGFDRHPHRDMEIVTWVLQGSLVHQDSTGHSGVIYPGLAQRMSAGTGIFHSEKNDSWTLTGAAEHSDPVHFIQMWVVPDEDGVAPGYEQLEIADADAAGPAHGGGLRHPRARRRRRHPDPEPLRRSPRRPPRHGQHGMELPEPPGCTCSWPGASSSWRGRAPCRRATPCASPGRAGSG